MANTELSSEECDRIRELSEQTYLNNVEQMSKEHPDEYVAIRGNQILGYGKNWEEITRKFYKTKNLPVLLRQIGIDVSAECMITPRAAMLDLEPDLEEKIE